MPSTESMSARERAAKVLVPGATVSGFTIKSAETIDELDAEAYVIDHVASGARLLFLACEDENKAFAIGFKTPPANDTGVFHILEHSVLCGSAKFPVKEPFVDLIKSSMQTFLNAMTYPDKTIYPVASTNEQDLYNLMDVYMDAVLNPAIYTKKTIFEQEGWHYELDRAEDGAPQRLRYNGVVFNEMKGALSDPMDVLDNAVNRALFPNTAYACESGGNPRAIPSLTYEQFLDTHARHYNLANSYITLYGDLDPKRALAFLNERYLCDVARAHDAAARGARGIETPGAPNELARQEPIVCDYTSIDMVTTPDNALVGLGYVLGDALDRKRVIAADILFEALLGTNEAPMKKAILAANLGGDVTSYTSAACLQPYELIILQNAQPEVARRLREVIKQSARELVDGGIPRDRLEAVICGNEFDLRQRDYGTADGVVIACDALSTWLYDDAAATLALKYGPVYEELRQELSGSYFEDLLRELVLDTNHSALVELKPQEASDGDDPEAAELAATLEKASDQQLAAIDADVEALRAAQEAEDSPEARATLPRLHVSDIGPARPEPALTVDETTPLPCLKHAIPTRGLSYALAYFDLSHLTFDELPYVTIMANLMRRLPTAQHTADELDSHIGANLGFLSLSAEVVSESSWDKVRPVLTISAGALSEKIEALAQIPREVWGETLFEDTDRMRDVITQMRIAQEQRFLMNGHSAAVARSYSYTSPAGVLSEQLSGVDFYRFLRELVEHFDERAEGLCNKLRDLQKRIFVADGAIVSFTGSDNDYRTYWDAAGTLGLGERIDGNINLQIPTPVVKNEAFIIPSDVCFAGKAVDPRRLDLAVDGTWGVAAGALSFDYLWNEIRVKGGAYGCGFRCAADRQLAFYTYRDPAIDPSLERIDRAGAWLRSFDPAPEVFEGFIVSCVSGHDAPAKPYGLARRQDGEFFAKRPVDWRETRRNAMLSATPEKVRALADDIERVAANAPVCVFGGREIIEASTAGLIPIDLLK